MIMGLYENLVTRSHSQCELCGSRDNISLFEIPPIKKPNEDNSLILCHYCIQQLSNLNNLDKNHWRCLTNMIWSELLAVQVLCYRILTILKSESWALNLLEQFYIDDELKAFALEGLPDTQTLDENKPTLDSNGTRLNDGDSVTLIKDLDVKGAGFTAKRGTLVKNISLTNNPDQIEGKVNGVHIVLLVKFLKKA
jgi:protein PhnA